MTPPDTTAGRRLPAIAVLGALVAALWLLEAVDGWVLGDRLQDFAAIRPRSWSGLKGIVLAPWFHTGFGHLAANTVPLVLLGALVLFRGARTWVLVTGGVTLLAGAATWLLARSALHLGASLVVFGYLGFLLVVGFAERSPVWIAVGLAVALTYGGTLVWGILPIRSGVSWEGHLFGAASGVLLALAAARDRPGPGPG